MSMFKSLSNRMKKMSSGLTVGKSASEDLFLFNECFQPMAEKGPEGAALRKKGFSLADPNGNGLCSLAEIEGFIMGTLCAKYPKDGKTSDKGRDLFELFRPCYIKAYNDAKDIMADSGEVLDGTKDSTADDFVSFGEFRLLNAYLCIYATMFDAFSKIDGGGEGTEGDDRRIDEEEWMKGFKEVSDHGFVCFQGLKDKKAAKKVFGDIDDNGGGIILLDEWCAYIKKTEVAAGTELGKSLMEEQEGGAPPKDKKKKKKGKK